MQFNNSNRILSARQINDKKSRPLTALKSNNIQKSQRDQATDFTSARFNLNSNESLKFDDRTTKDGNNCTNSVINI